ncbi:hypothetical protein FN976_28600 [Caenimonas sedimenti]|uniref:Calcineurin-like phosphoesterase domain-containing protein n=1 Tax=Caenimonas sedimenti TaxID=2596921 RepID=A0A562ZDL8_9BURK|nr:metallophosphoesterase family protein [Caenimonas sedimenti]TWO63120.1 hypothetical protein FN976_28600 [Caenimonas sedimenti]
MNLLILSDLHVEFAPFVPNPAAVQQANVVILAGDIHKGVAGLHWAHASFPGKEVIYVAGNHEYYGGHWTRTLAEMRSASEELDIHFLENDAIELDGVRILGTSLWADFLYFDAAMRHRAELDYKVGLMDCRRIKADPVPGLHWNSSRHNLSPLHVRLRSEESLAWLTAQLEQDFAGPTVVVTHHLPHRNSVAERYVDDALTPGFVTLVPEDAITRADLWVHGHTHDSVDFVLGAQSAGVDAPSGKGTRVVCNPRGYPMGGGKDAAFENARFIPDLVVEVA